MSCIACTDHIRCHLQRLSSISRSAAPDPQEQRPRQILACNPSKASLSSGPSVNCWPVTAANLVGGCIWTCCVTYGQENLTLGPPSPSLTQEFDIGFDRLEAYQDRAFTQSSCGSRDSPVDQLRIKWISDMASVHQHGYCDHVARNITFTCDLLWQKKSRYCNSQDATYQRLPPSSKTGGTQTIPSSKLW